MPALLSAWWEWLTGMAFGIRSGTVREQGGLTVGSQLHHLPSHDLILRGPRGGRAVTESEATWPEPQALKEAPQLERSRNRLNLREGIPTAPHFCCGLAICSTNFHTNKRARAWGPKTLSVTLTFGSCQCFFLNKGLPWQWEQEDQASFISR